MHLPFCTTCTTSHPCVLLWGFLVDPGWACLPRCHLPLRAGLSPPKKRARAKWVPSPPSPPSPHTPPPTSRSCFHIFCCFLCSTWHIFIFLMKCTTENTKPGLQWLAIDSSVIKAPHIISEIYSFILRVVTRCHLSVDTDWNVEVTLENLNSYNHMSAQRAMVVINLDLVCSLSWLLTQECWQYLRL